MRNFDAVITGMAIQSRTGRAILTVERAGLCHELHFIDENGKAEVVSLCTPAERAEARGVIVESGLISGPNTALPIVKYRKAHSVARKGIVVKFHGGPYQNNTVDDLTLIRELVRYGFDVVSVNYRGSSGFGDALERALGPPTPRIAADDLARVVEWLRQQGSNTTPIGFVGDSFGGLAGVSHLQSSHPRLDFMVLNSGFIENSALRRKTTCLNGTSWQAQVFGFTAIADGCEVRGTGMLNVVAPSATPVLLMIGQADLQTDPSIAQDWMAAVNRKGGGCASAIQSDGGHMIESWPLTTKRQATDKLLAWIDRVLTGNVKCGSISFAK